MCMLLFQYQSLPFFKLVILLTLPIFDVEPVIQRRAYDNALAATVKILIEIHRSKRLDYINEDAAVRQRMNVYKTTMGFGLHCGW